MIHHPLRNLLTGGGSSLTRQPICSPSGSFGRETHTPPASEHIMSVALPQQWSEPLPQPQSRIHPISRTRPGRPATISFAPSTATCLHAPTDGYEGVL